MSAILKIISYAMGVILTIVGIVGIIKQIDEYGNKVQIIDKIYFSTFFILGAIQFIPSKLFHDIKFGKTIVLLLGLGPFMFWIYDLSGQKITYWMDTLPFLILLVICSVIKPINIKFGNLNKKKAE